MKLQNEISFIFESDEYSKNEKSKKIACFKNARLRQKIYEKRKKDWDSKLINIYKIKIYEYQFIRIWLRYLM